MKRRVLFSLTAFFAVSALAVAVFLPRLEIGHTEPAVGQQSKVLYDYLIVSRVAVLVAGLALAGLIYFLGTRGDAGSGTPHT